MEEMVDSARGRRLLSTVLAVVVLTVLGCGAWSAHQQRVGPTPVSVVTAYAELVAAGRLTEASALVPPDRWNGWRGPATTPLDRGVTATLPALLTDAALSDSIELVTVAVVDSPSSRDVVVRVEYRLDDQEASSLLRVRAEPTAWYEQPRWMILDPLLVPVRATTELPLLGAYRISGVAIPTGTIEDPPPVSDVLLYPGRYRVDGPHTPRVIVEDRSIDVADGQSGPVVGVSSFALTPLVTRSLNETMSAFARSFVADCQHRAVADSRCPRVTRPDLPAAQRPDLSLSGTIDGNHVHEHEGRLEAQLVWTFGEDRGERLVITASADADRPIDPQVSVW